MFLSLRRVLYFGLAAIFLLTACGGATATPVTVSTSTPLSPPSTEGPTPVSLAGPSLGTTLTWLDGAQLVYIPAGEFVMGANGEDNPQHKVNLSAYWIYRTEVTNRMYALCIASGVCAYPLDVQSSTQVNSIASLDLPVTSISWDQADAYCKWVSASLPTEAQWEKAARGPEGNLYPWGDSAPNCSLANFAGCVGASSRINVYLKGMSYYQAYDMAGNVFEWTRDWYDPSYYANAPQTDPSGPESGTVRAIRGSGYQTEAESLALATRSFLEPGQFGNDLGFRCVVEKPFLPPPFCQVSAYVPRVPGMSAPDLSACTPPNVQPAGSYCQAGTSFVTFDVNANSPIESIASKNNLLDCSPVDGNRVLCSGAPDVKDDVTVCASGCGQSALQTPQGLACPPGFSASSASQYVCEFNPANVAQVPCSAGVACEPVLDQNGTCPSGFYFDQAVNACVPVGGVNSQCMAGYTYNPQTQCCQLQTLGQYPGCGPGEYYDTLLGCLPVPGGLGGDGCVTFSLVTQDCYVKPPASCGEIRNQFKCDHTPGCKWYRDASNPPGVCK